MRQLQRDAWGTTHSSWLFIGRPITSPTLPRPVEVCACVPRSGYCPGLLCAETTNEKSNLVSARAATGTRARDRGALRAARAWPPRGNRG